MSVLNDFRRLTRSQRHTFLAAFLGWTMDSLDFFLLIFCVKAIAAEFHTQPSAVLGAVFLTQAFRPVGALLFGMLADRYGRRPVLMVNILSFSACSRPRSRNKSASAWRIRCAGLSASAWPRRWAAPVTRCSKSWGTTFARRKPSGSAKARARPFT